MVGSNMAPGNRPSWFVQDSASFSTESPMSVLGIREWLTTLHGPGTQDLITAWVDYITAVSSPAPGSGPIIYSAT